jgi:glycosyltransferase involved in cell wall biosynthesis
MSDFIADLAHRVSSAKATAHHPKRKIDESSGSPAPEDGVLAPIVRAAASTFGELFDVEYYVDNNPDLSAVGVDPITHFLEAGANEGRWPNPYFDPVWYLKMNPDVGAAGLNPLVHYVTLGDAQGRKPCLVFDTQWYRRRYEIPKDTSALAHFLQRRISYEFSPNPDFDVHYYARNNPDVVEARIDPFQHFLLSGLLEGRSPSPEFDARFYARRYMNGSKENPFLHYLDHKHEAGVYGRLPDDEPTIPRELKRFSKPGSDFEEFRPLPSSVPRRAKLLAFYLPQFHAIPENDVWWGRGFTEWTNVTRGLSRFKGHYQPRIPRDLGFYSLESNETLRRQVKMAQAAGVHGFIYYYYSFNGSRLLEGPLERFLNDRSINMPFLLMWANENWTRRWDGADSEILMSQDYHKDDDGDLIKDVARHFRDPRYIRLQGRPIIMIYRPRLIPRTAETISRWRRIFEQSFDERPIIVMAQGFGDLDPTEYGLDGAVEFPPHKLIEDMANMNDELEMLDPEFSGQVLRYDDVVRASLDDRPTKFPLIRTAIPSWDNDARRQGAGTTIFGSTPTKYEGWLSDLIQQTADRPFFGERMVCVNAWNEWAEGAYLEPDQYYGSAYLNATGRAVAGLCRPENSCRLLLVGHDAHQHGAQELLLHIGRTLRRSFGVEIEFLLLEGGPLQARYAENAPVTIANTDAALKARLAALAERGIRSAIVNTTAAARTVRIAAHYGIECVVLVHELPRIIREKNLTEGAVAALRHARNVVFPAASVRSAILDFLELPERENQVDLPQGIYKPIVYSSKDEKRIRKALKLAAGEKLVLGVGFADLRKGFDLFIQVWRLLRSARPRIHFCWVGRIDPLFGAWLQAEIRAAEATGTFHMIGFTDEVAAYYSAADLFLLSSREDPFPSVALEALSAGLPVVTFDGSGGIPDLIRDDANLGTVVHQSDIGAMSAEVGNILTNGRVAENERSNRCSRASERFQWKSYVSSLLKLALPSAPTVSVAVLNYNYSQYMRERLTSIFRQTHAVHEILVLDDCSADNSINVINEVAAEWDRDIQLVMNERNSGSVFAQWQKAAELATGEFLWIAEADDSSQPDFLLRVLPPLATNGEVMLSFSDSSTIDSSGAVTGESYKPYYATVEPAALADTQVLDGSDFVKRLLSVKNIILNVSAVVWRRDALLRALRTCGSDLSTFKVAGDWRIYQEILTEPGARVNYESRPLNVHRRHNSSVTHRLNSRAHLDEISRLQEYARLRFPQRKGLGNRQRRYLMEVANQLSVKNSGLNSPSPVSEVGECRPAPPTVERRGRRKARQHRNNHDRKD